MVVTYLVLVNKTRSVPISAYAMEVRTKLLHCENPADYKLLILSGKKLTEKAIAEDISECK